MKTLLTATALMLSMTAAASAASTTGSTLLAGGPITTTDSIATGFCWYTNFGTASITPSSQQLFQSNSTTEMTSAKSCANGTSVAPNQTCVIYTSSTLGSGVGYSCKVTFSTSAAHVRGSFEIDGDTSNVLTTVELR